MYLITWVLNIQTKSEHTIAGDYNSVLELYGILSNTENIMFVEIKDKDGETIQSKTIEEK